MKAHWRSLILISLGALFGGCTGYVGSFASHGVMPNPERYAFLAERIRSPHHVPQFAGAASLRFAMVHDVLHERFAVHSPNWYETRNRDVQLRLQMLPDHDSARWPLVDDLAVGLDRLGQPEQATPILRDKLKQQQSAGQSRAELYTSFANLGTMLIHAHLNTASLGDEVSQERVREGIDLIRQSVEVNPQAHFGRERWQAAIAEFLLATCANQKLLTKFDCLGNRLDLDIESMLDREANWFVTRYGRPNFTQLTQSSAAVREVPEFFVPNSDLNDATRWKVLKPIREYITTVGAEQGWSEVDVPSHRQPVPFDEPVLGIIGMWRQGGGANPHFALALAETMLRVGQRYLAWNAYERASRLANRYSPVPEIQQFLKKHCADRQTAIEETLNYVGPDVSQRTTPPWQHISLPPTPGTVNQLRPAFTAELEDGLAFQRAYQDFETRQLAAGTAISDPAFYDRFQDQLQSIATEPGLEETILWVPKTKLRAWIKNRVRAAGVFGSGLGAFCVSLIVLLKNRRQHRSPTEQTALSRSRQ